MPAKKPSTTKVSQATIDSMKQMGMTKAIAKANSGGASKEFVEGAKRMYGDRIKPSQNVQQPAKSQNVQRPAKSQNVQLPAKANPKAVAATQKQPKPSRGTSPNPRRK